MRMTPEEFKREHREQEGDPHIKRKRRQRMRELAQRRLHAAVKGADVVLVNPTEYAVALRYRSDEDRAPRVVAKGRKHQAERIREIARKEGVPIVAQPPLCRLVHKLVPENREIPAQLYHAVAEVLAYVYRLKNRTVLPRAEKTAARRPASERSRN
jgi:flagellar biosynthetic protein FlhB